AYSGIGRHGFGRRVDVDSHIGLQFLIGPGKTTRLFQAIAHLRPDRGIKSVASLRGSAREANDSAIKLTGRSGLSRAARPTLAQYSTCPAMLRCSAWASVRACSYSV